MSRQRQREMFEPELRKIEIFEDLTDRELRGLAGLFDEAPLPANHLIFRQGDLAEGFYVIREGAVVIFRDGGDDEPVQLLARLGPGDHFGEFGIYDELVRTASARTSEASRILRIGKQALLGVLAEHPTVALRLQTVAGRRPVAARPGAARPGAARPGAARLGLGRRREVRTLIGRDVALTLEDGTSHRARLVNLSRGGLCLSGVPAAWRVGERARFHLGLGSGMIQLDGEVAWRRDAAVGVAFPQRSQGHFMKIQWALRQMVRETPPSQSSRPIRSSRAGSTTAASHSR